MSAELRKEDAVIWMLKSDFRVAASRYNEYPRENMFLVFKFHIASSFS